MYDIKAMLKDSNLTFLEDGEAKHFSSYRGGGKLKYIVTPASVKELELLANIITQTGVPYKVLGAGTNCLIKDEGYYGLIVCTSKLDGISVSENFITSGGGESLPNLAFYASKKNLGGLETLSGIPSSVGGAIYMNAGAFGSEIRDTLVCVDCFSIKENKVQRLQAKDIPFCYRNSGGAFDGYVICSATFKLSFCADVRQKTEFYIKERLAKQPKEPSLGCVFKNPIGFSAGYLIESVGLKGCRIGGAAISEKHANFIVNKGGGTASDYLSLVELTKATVYEKYKTELELEIIILG